MKRNVTTICRTLLLSMLLAAGTAMATTPVVNATEKKKSEWKMVFSDEFNVDGAPNPEFWSFHGRRPAFWARYATDSQELAYVKEGSLVLVARNTPENSDTVAFQTGAICTRGTFAFTYGKVEFRARFTTAQGAWPALWLMPQKAQFGNWPHSGEIDVMEHLNHDEFVYQTVHTTKTRAVTTEDSWENSVSHTKQAIDRSAFNTYGIEWSEEKIDFFTNGVKTFSYMNLGKGPEQYPFVADFYLILNQALGGSWVGEVKADELPVQMEVDYVRVYQRTNKK